jgi:lipopolysaccharide/colanic/teichoic acid biosynthesis glycosyltransferase
MKRERGPLHPPDSPINFTLRPLSVRRLGKMDVRPLLKAEPFECVFFERRFGSLGALSMSIPTLRFSKISPSDRPRLADRRSDKWRLSGCALILMAVSWLTLKEYEIGQYEWFLSSVFFGIVGWIEGRIALNIYRTPSVTKFEAGVLGTLAGYPLLALFQCVMRFQNSSLFLVCSFLLSCCWLMAGFRLWSADFQRIEKDPSAPFLFFKFKLDSPDLPPRSRSLRDVQSALAPQSFETFHPSCLSAYTLPEELSKQALPLRNCVCETLAGRISRVHYDVNILSDYKMTFAHRLYKRTFDITIVLLSLPVLLPVMGAVALMIRLDSPGPALFIQNRCGKDGKPFRIYKFRSMTTDAESRGNQFTQDGDRRVTPLGRILRKYRLDELPQLFNVLKGEMSLIGPRPEQVSFVGRFEQDIRFYHLRHRVKPGITGWAQVSQGYAANVEQTKEKLEYDLYYVKNASILLDNIIVFKTLETILTGFGAR